jgi:hypothetical protein
MISFSAFVDEYCKIAGLPPPLPAAAKMMQAAPAAAKMLPKPKLYGQEGFNALMQGTRSAKANPFQALAGQP